MKTKTTNCKPFAVYLEDARFGMFVLNFVEVRGDIRHCTRLHLETTSIRMLAHRLGELIRHVEKELADIKTGLHAAGGD